MKNNKKVFLAAVTYLFVSVFACIAIGSERWYHLKSSFSSERDSLLYSKRISDVAVVVNGNNHVQASLLVTTQNEGMFWFSYDASLSAAYQTLPDSLINWDSWERYSPYQLGDLRIHSLASFGDTLFMGSDNEGVIRALKTSNLNSPDFSLSLHSEGLPAAFTLGQYKPLSLLEVTNEKFFALVGKNLFSSSPSDKAWKKEQVPVHEHYGIRSFHAKGNTVCCLTPHRESYNTFSTSSDAGETWNIFDANELIGLPSDSIVGLPIGILCTSTNTILIAVRIVSKFWKDNNSDQIIFLLSHDAGHTWSMGDTVINGNPRISLTGLNGRLFMSIRNPELEENFRVSSDWKAGVYVSDNNGQSWKPFSTGITDTLVQFVKASNGKVIAATRTGNIFLYDPLLMQYWEKERMVKTVLPRQFTRLEERMAPNYLFLKAASKTFNNFRFNGSDERLLDLKGRVINVRSWPSLPSQRLLSSQIYFAQ